MSNEDSIPGRGPEKAGRRGEVKCPHCSAMVHPVRLDRHIQRRHSDLLPAVPDAAPAPVHRKASPFVPCPVCGKVMHRRFLVEHSKQHKPDSPAKS
jgi:hypothetical protein